MVEDDDDDEQEQINNLEARLKKLKGKKVLRQSPPQPVATPDFGPLIAVCKEYIEALATNTRFNDAKGAIFETAVEAVFGPDVFKWINKIED